MSLFQSIYLFHDERLSARGTGKQGNWLWNKGIIRQERKNGGKFTTHSCWCQLVNKRKLKCSANLMILEIAVSCGQIWVINSWICTFNLSSTTTQSRPSDHKPKQLWCSSRLLPWKLLVPLLAYSHPVPRSWHYYLVNSLFFQFEPGFSDCEHQHILV